MLMLPVETIDSAFNEIAVMWGLEVTTRFIGSDPCCRERDCASVLDTYSVTVKTRSTPEPETFELTGFEHGHWPPDKQFSAGEVIGLLAEELVHSPDPGLRDRVREFFAGQESRVRVEDLESLARNADLLERSPTVPELV